ncbi:MAG TPA: ferritin-like domain-containing protein [Polyangiaceae bacterium]
MHQRTALASLLTIVSAAMAACGSSPRSPAEAADAGPDARADSALAGEDAASDAATASDVAVSDGPPVSEAGCEAGTMLGPDGGCMPISVRRPFLVGASMRSAAARPRGDWTSGVAESTGRLDERTRARLAQVWLADALEEHASVAAFARFTMLLLAVGAPPELAVQSQRASIDEVRHAELCFALAARYAGRAYGPTHLSLEGALRPMSLAEVAALTSQEGCVGETLGAALAHEQRSHATDAQARRALARIARDEERHAALAWEFTRWAVLQGGDGVRDAVSHAVDGAIRGTLAAEVRTYDDVDPAAWHAHGRVTCAEAREVAVLAIERVVRPALGALLV